MLTIILAVGLTTFGLQVGNPNTPAQILATQLGDQPRRWSIVADSHDNGLLPPFMRGLNPKVMVRPNSTYSKSAIAQLDKKYSRLAKEINRHRSGQLTDSTIVPILSESFSDPKRIPGLELNENPIPLIDSIKADTDSGLMLSSGYGGGTANIEFSQLTGMSMALFSPSITTPYQQVIPTLDWYPTFNQLWGKKHSIGIHPATSGLYMRGRNYQKFQFDHFYTKSGEDEQITCLEAIADQPFISDECAYSDAYDQIRSNADNNFVQLITIQNHHPYRIPYEGNKIEVTSTLGAPELSAEEKEQIKIYSGGLKHTDQATIDFLDKLNGLDKPVTVIFYGDHLASIFPSAAQNKDNTLALHQTDYFIWSNSASEVNSEPKTNGTISPNFLMAQTAEHLNAKVSPFLALLTQLRTKISAMELPLTESNDTLTHRYEEATYLDLAGKQVKWHDLDPETQDLIRDYELVQYDVSAGKQYLRDSDFFK